MNLVEKEIKIMADILAKDKEMAKAIRGFFHEEPENDPLDTCQKVLRRFDRVFDRSDTVAIKMAGQDNRVSWLLDCYVDEWGETEDFGCYGLSAWLADQALNQAIKNAAKDAGEENPVSHLDDNGNWVNVSYALTDSYGHPMKWYWSTGAALDGFMNHCDDPNYDEWDSLECYLEDENEQVERRNFTISI
ncbi:hypothetical protein ACLOE0_03045 [Limosilactobacillus fermentum]|uniref:hypothetical protein n=1 Tax=Limosilactobacillus fermentum TaxID=1613 RepID=UPI003EB6AE3D